MRSSVATLARSVSMFRRWERAATGVSGMSDLTHDFPPLEVFIKSDKDRASRDLCQTQITKDAGKTRMKRMDHWERLAAAIEGTECDHPPVSFWRHWPEDDQNPGALADVTVRWQRRHDFDLVKFMPAGTYGVEDWGARSQYVPSIWGHRTVIDSHLIQLADWANLKRLDPHHGSLGRQIEALRLAAGELGGRVPILQTIFSPLTTAYKLRGEQLFTDLKTHPDLVEPALRVIAETTVDFANASLEAGAHGVFFATQCGVHELMSVTDHRRYGEHFDRAVFAGLSSGARFNMVHVHGENTMFDTFAAYPVQMLNWHDQITAPSLAAGLEKFGGLAVGGLDELGALARGPIEQIRADVRAALVATQGRRLMLGPGCVLSIETPDENIRVALETVRSRGSCGFPPGQDYVLTPHQI